jgi:predicted DNA-binding transcriptional regulator AlpA
MKEIAGTKFLTDGELLQVLGLTSQITLWRWRKSKQLPQHYRIAGRNYTSELDVPAYVESCRVLPEAYRPVK